MVLKMPRKGHNHRTQPTNDNTLRKYAYSNIMKILPPKNENIQIKKIRNFHISA